MKLAQRLALCLALFALGLLFGPPLVAVFRGLVAPSDDAALSRAAYALLQAYDERYTVLLDGDVFSWSGAANDCGYDFAQLFGNDTPPLSEGRDWTPFNGYFDLLASERARFTQEVEGRRIEQLKRRFNAFGLTFLDVCIRQTAFADSCGERVRDALAQADLLSNNALPAGGPRFDQRREETTLCRYLDGLAARQSQPLSNPPGPRTSR